MAVIIKGAVKIARPIVPTDIAGLQLWLDASDSTTLFQNSDGTTPATADSDPIGYWGDKSRNGSHAIQTVSGNRPLLRTAVKNGKNVLRFTGVSDYLASVLSINMLHVFVVEYISVTDNYNTLFGKEAVVSSAPHIVLRRHLPAVNRTWGHNNSSDWGPQANWQVNGTTTNLQSDVTWGVLSCYSNDTVSSKFEVSSKQYRLWKGDIAEILVYDSRITGANLTNINNYLNTKWGVY
jgi:hypothetical protein